MCVHDMAKSLRAVFDSNWELTQLLDHDTRPFECDFEMPVVDLVPQSEHAYCVSLLCFVDAHAFYDPPEATHRRAVFVSTFISSSASLRSSAATSEESKDSAEVVAPTRFSKTKRVTRFYTFKLRIPRVLT